jgi:hypothetical protein
MQFNLLDAVGVGRRCRRGLTKRGVPWRSADAIHKQIPKIGDWHLRAPPAPARCEGASTMCALFAWVAVATSHAGRSCAFYRVGRACNGSSTRLRPKRSVRGRVRWTRGSRRALLTPRERRNSDRRVGNAALACFPCRRRAFCIWNALRSRAPHGLSGRSWAQRWQVQVTAAGAKE